MKNKILFFAICIALVACEKDNSEPSFNYGSVTDIDGNTYRTIQIGEQTWTVDNLKTKHQNNGDEIAYITLDKRSVWVELTSPACCWANFTPKYADSVRNDGMLYNWYTVQDDNVCPTGWRVPNNDDWNELFDYAETHGNLDKKAAEKLKSDGGWITACNGGAAGTSLDGINEFGFEAKAAGCFVEIGNRWSSTGGGGFAYYWSLDTTIVDEMYLYDEDMTVYDFANIFYMGYADDTRNLSKDVHKWYTEPAYKKNGYSIRCIKD